MPIPTREELAEKLYRLRWLGEPPYPFDQVGTAERQGWLDASSAAIAALKGPRTGEELHNAIQTALRWGGLSGPLFPWAEVEEPMKTALKVVASTFADQRAFTPCPEGWAEGWAQQKYPGIPTLWNRGGSHYNLPDTEAGRIASHVLAGWRPADSADHMERVLRLTAERDESLANIQALREIASGDMTRCAAARRERDQALEQVADRDRHIASLVKTIDEISQGHFATRSRLKHSQDKVLRLCAELDSMKAERDTALSDKEYFAKVLGVEREAHAMTTTREECANEVIRGLRDDISMPSAEAERWRSLRNRFVIPTGTHPSKLVDEVIHLIDVACSERWRRLSAERDEALLRALDDVQRLEQEVKRHIGAVAKLVGDLEKERREHGEEVARANRAERNLAAAHAELQLQSQTPSWHHQRIEALEKQVRDLTNAHTAIKSENATLRSNVSRLASEASTNAADLDLGRACRKAIQAKS